MNIQLSAHPHLYRLLIWFEKEELLVQQLAVKLDPKVSVHKRKPTTTTVLINDALEALWDKYNAKRLSAQALLIESSKWIAKKV
jgi:hypothetical protein